MAKKPSSGSKRSKRPVDKSAAKGGGIMSLNKSNTSPFMKIVIIVIIVSMVTLFLAGGVTGIIELFKPRPKAAAVDPVVALKTQYDPRIQSYTLVLASDPTSYTLLVNLANAHLSYAQDLQALSASPRTPTMEAISQQLVLARDTYQKAAKANKNADSPVLVDYAITTYYSGDATEAVKIAEGVIKRDPTFAAAFYNIAIFYEAVNRTDLAVAAYQKYIALDPTGKNGNMDYAKQQLKALGGSVPATGSVTTITP